MKIISLKAENFKRIKAIELNPNGEAVVIQGANAQGKTSVLDSIAYALASMQVKKPIRDGESRSEIEIDLGDYLVKKVTTDKGAYLRVETKEGAELKSPQKILDKIVGQISFDPLDFSRMKAADQRVALVKMIPALDFTKLDISRKLIFDSRTETGRQLKRIEAERNGIDVPEGTPIEAVDVKEIMATINRLNDQISDEKSILADSEREFSDLLLYKVKAEKELDGMEFLINKQKEQLVEIDKDLEMLKKTPNDNPSKIPEWESARDSAQSRVEQAATINEGVALKKRWVGLDEQVHNFRKAGQQQTAQIEKIDKEKKTALEIVPLPIPGLGITEKDVTFNGTPFTDLAESEKLKVSFSMAMAQNPALKVVFIRDGSLLDTASRSQVIEMAKEKDYQVWMEITDDNAQAGIIIEDGQLAATIPENVEPEEAALSA